MANPTAPTAPLATAEGIREWLEAELPRLIESHGVPAAAAGVLVDGEVVGHATGVLHLGTGVEATDDALFQIGSITKVWTATLVMQLVDDGLLDLDVPIRTYLPEFRIADEDAAAVITARHLLSHQAGFEGDLFTDTGRGDDCVEKYVATLADTPQLFEPGTQFSYNNAGYVVLGRLVEVLRDGAYDDVLTDRLLRPLGLAHAAPGPYEAIMHRVAQGHLPGPEGALVPAPIWSLVRSNGPAGSTLSMRVADLLAFARMHASGGLAADGTRVLSEASVAAMQETQVGVPDIGLMGESWGLGWELDPTPAGPMISHDGSTIGQNAFLRVLPEAGVAVALLTNGGDVMSISRELFESLFAQLTGGDVLRAPQTPVDAEAVLDEVAAARFVGTYSASVMDVVVTVDEEGRLWAQDVGKGEFASLVSAAPPARVVPHGDGSLITTEQKMGTHWIYVFLGDDGQGRAAFLHTGRAMPRATA